IPSQGTHCPAAECSRECRLEYRHSNEPGRSRCIHPLVATLVRALLVNHRRGWIESAHPVDNRTSCHRRSVKALGRSVYNLDISHRLASASLSCLDDRGGGPDDQTRGFSTG